MTTRPANVKSIEFLASPRGDDHEAILLVSFDLIGMAYTGGSDTITLGGGGYESEQPTTDTIATMIANRRRDGRTWTLGQVMGGWCGRQATSTNGPDFFAQSASISAGNIVGVVLMSAPSGGFNVTTTMSQGGWDAACTLLVSALASGN